MNKEKLEKLSNDELIKKQKATRTLFGIFIPIILVLIYYTIDEYLTGTPLNMPNITIILCSVGGMLSLLPTMKRIKKELKRRKV